MGIRPGILQHNAVEKLAVERKKLPRPETVSHDNGGLLKSGYSFQIFTVDLAEELCCDLFNICCALPNVLTIGTAQLVRKELSSFPYRLSGRCVALYLLRKSLCEENVV